MTEATHYLGIIPLLLVAFFYQRIPRGQLKLWGSLAAFFLVVSLGPRLQLLGTTFPLPLPYALIDSWPIFSAVRAVGRASVLVGLSVAVLVAWVVATQVRRRQFAYALAVVLFVEFLFWPVSRTPAVLSPAYTQVRSLSGSQLIELPAATNYTAASRALYATLTHGKTTVGNIALERAQNPQERLEAQSLPALRQLLHLRTTHIHQDRDDFFAQDPNETFPDTLRWLDIGGILVHSDSLSQLQLATVRAYLEEDLALTPVDHNDALLYDVSPLLGRDLGDGVFMSRDAGWENVAYDAKLDTHFAELPREAVTSLYNVTTQERTARLEFTIAPDSHGNIAVKTETGVTVADLAGEPGEQIRFDALLQPGRTNLIWGNKLPEKVIIQDPVLTSTATARPALASF